jgi:hypothetical protein
MISRNDPAKKPSKETLLPWKYKLFTTGNIQYTPRTESRPTRGRQCEIIEESVARSQQTSTKNDQWVLEYYVRQCKKA